MKLLSGMIHELNAVGTNVWAVFCIALGTACILRNESEGGLMLIGGGLALLRGSHSETGVPPSPPAEPPK